MIRQILKLAMSGIVQVSFYEKKQSNLTSKTALETPKSGCCLLSKGGQSLEGFQAKLVLKLVWPDLVITGGC
jgi:hypothetical protein